MTVVYARSPPSSARTSAGVIARLAAAKQFSDNLALETSHCVEGGGRP